MDKIENALKLMQSAIAHDDYLFYLSIGDEENYKLYQKILSKNKEFFKYTKVLFCSLLFSFLKEQVVENRGNLEYESKINDDYLEELIKVIGEKRGNNYYIDGYKIENNANIIALIRNKLAHGDYYILNETNEIMIYKEEKEITEEINNEKYEIRQNEEETKVFRKIKIDIDKLTFMSILINQYIDIVTKNKPINRNLIEIKPTKDVIKGENISNKEELLKVFEKIYIHNFDIKGINGKQPTLKEVSFINTMFEILRSYMAKPDYKPIKNKFIDDMRKRNILVNTTKKQYISYEESKLLLNQIENIDDFYDLPLEIQLIYLGYLSNDTIEDKDGKLIIQKGCQININLITALEKIENFDYFDNKLPKREQEDFLVSSIEQSISSALLRFQAIYCYALDKVYKEGEGYKLNRENLLDFKKLDLKNIEPTYLEIDDKPLQDITKQVENLYKSYINVEENIKKAEENIEKLEKGNNPNKEKGIEFNKERIENLKKSKPEKLQKLKDKQQLKKEMELDFKENYDYFRNKAIINGIRNAIAHGNVEVDKYNVTNNLNEVNIIFKDIYEDKITFEATIPYSKFETIYSDHNTEEILKFLYTKKEENKVKTK